MKNSLKSIFTRRKPEEKKSGQEKPVQRNSRKYIRYPSFSTLEIVSRNKQGDKESMTITVRDESHTGFGAIYVGSKAPLENIEYYVHESNNVFRKIELSWSSKLIKDVYHLGFRIAEEKHFAEIPS